MHLTDYEKAMADGAHGAAKRRAMDLLVRYGKALGAERLVETANVAGTWSVSNPVLRDYAARGMDRVFSEFNLDSDEVVETPHAEAFACQLIQGVDPSSPEMREQTGDAAELQHAGEAYFGGKGVSIMSTCTPYQVGNVPAFGEHCAWMESSAVIYCNSVLGARTNAEGRESTGAASITRRIPYWGYHLPENRKATHCLTVDAAFGGDAMIEWGLLGYWTGLAVGEDIPLIANAPGRPDRAALKHFGAAAASSGGVEMYHIPGVTPEAAEAETGAGSRPLAPIIYDAAARRAAYERLNVTARDSAVDFVMLGCPHDSLEQIACAAQLLDGRKLAAGTALWIFTPRAIREQASEQGLVRRIEAAGAKLYADTCPAISRLMPKGVKVVATDSAKQAHYLPAITGVQCWFGSIAECVDAAVTGRWQGGLR